MINVIIFLALSGAVGLIGFGVYSEVIARRRSGEPLAEPSLLEGFFPEANLPPKPNFLQSRLQQFQIAVETHPFKAYGVIETLFWLACLIPLVDHVLTPRGSWASYFTWLLVIGPHEVGHIICSPFGTLLMFLGGSIWQVLFWLLVATYALLVHRYITSALICWLIVGHSFMDMAVYIGDARSRDLPLLFGMDSSHHDWWNILRRLGLLEYDHLLAGIAVMLGVLIVLSAIFLGIWTAWVFPRLKLGRSPRFQGNIFKITAKPDLYSPDGIPRI